MRYSTPYLPLIYTCSTIFNFIISSIDKLIGERWNRLSGIPEMGAIMELPRAGTGCPPTRIKYHIIFVHTAVLKGTAVFFCSTGYFIFLSCFIGNFIILQKSAAQRKGLRSLSVSEKCRGPPLVLRFLRFGKEGGQAYGKAIQNPGL